MKKASIFQGYALVIASAFLFGCMPLITKNIYADGVNALSVVFLRGVLSIPVLGLLALRQDGTLRIEKKALPSIAAIGLSGCCITPLLLFASYHYIASGTATVLHFIYPAVVLLISSILFRKKTPVVGLIAVGICLIGICLFYDPTQAFSWRGATLALVSGVAYATYVVLLAAFKYKKIYGFTLSFYIAIICTVCLLVVCLALGQLTFPATFKGWLWAFLLAIVVNVGAVVLFQQGTLVIGGERAAILGAVEPITGVVIGIIAFNETVNIQTIFGCFLVVAATVLIAVADMRKSKQ